MIPANGEPANRRGSRCRRQSADVASAMVRCRGLEGISRLLRRLLFGICHAALSSREASSVGGIAAFFGAVGPYELSV